MYEGIWLRRRRPGEGGVPVADARADPATIPRVHVRREEVIGSELWTEGEDA